MITVQNKTALDYYFQEKLENLSISQKMEIGQLNHKLN